MSPDDWLLKQLAKGIVANDITNYQLDIEMKWLGRTCISNQTKAKMKGNNVI